MIIGAHCVIYSNNAEADRIFLRDIFGLPYVDSGDGWLIFSLPPAEVSIHPAEKSGLHEMYLQCSDIQEMINQMSESKISYSPVQELSWGKLIMVTLPGGGKLGIYEPRHLRPSN